MIDFKQLQYFVVCADVGSFSEAAKILYTTQSNVSKSIKALEGTIGSNLFVRHPRGIRLTAKGRQVYQYAIRIIDELGALKDFSKTGSKEWLHISCNPSSWFADRFVEFYNAYYDENLHCQVYAAGLKILISRLEDYKDEMAFVYVKDSQRNAFHYSIRKAHLEFVELTSVDALLFLGKKHPCYGVEQIKQLNGEKIRLIQSYQGELLEHYAGTLEEENDLMENLDVAVVTNSDYIMERMLRNGKLGNISGNYLTVKEETNSGKGIPLDWEEKKVSFGYLKREGEELSSMAKVFLQFIIESLNLT